MRSESSESRVTDDDKADHLHRTQTNRSEPMTLIRGFRDPSRSESAWMVSVAYMKTQYKDPTTYSNRT